jgi:hypothetical protein
MTPAKIAQLRRPLPEKCIYLFSDKGRHLYVGRTDHFRQRMRNHSIDAADYNQASFAFRLAKAAFIKFKLAQDNNGEDIVSATDPSLRKELAVDPIFQQFFERAKANIREMDLRFVEETDPLRQALLEIYVAVVLKTPFNDFSTH